MGTRVRFQSVYSSGVYAELHFWIPAFAGMTVLWVQGYVFNLFIHLVFMQSFISGFRLSPE
jgi:hypothetical protein